MFDATFFICMAIIIAAPQLVDLTREFVKYIEE